MEITQSKMMSIVYYDCIYVWYIYPAFNNICANKHVIFFVNKIKNSFFEFMTF